MKLFYDEIGLYSLTKPKEAKLISKIIKSNYNKKAINIFDGNGGLGGNTINFSKYFNSVTSCEIDKERYLLLTKNIELYKLENVTVLNIDSVKYLFRNYKKYDIYFFDPPWGGPDYKKYKKLSLTLGSKSLLQIAKYLEKYTINKLLVYKLPFNYNFDEFNEFDYKLYKINNYYIIIIII